MKTPEDPTSVAIRFAHSMIITASALPSGAIETSAAVYDDGVRGDLSCMSTKIDSSTGRPDYSSLVYMAPVEMQASADKFCNVWAPKHGIVFPRGRFTAQEWIDVTQGIMVMASFHQRPDGSCPILNFDEDFIYGTTSQKEAIATCNHVMDTIINGCKCPSKWKSRFAANMTSQVALQILIMIYSGRQAEQFSGTVSNGK
jgi:hypothetical protein